LPIYEGTNGIQALDFVGRKCLRDGGEGLRALLSEMSDTAESSLSDSTQIKPLVEALRNAVVQCQDGLAHVLAHPEKSQHLAYNFMMLFGNSVSYWLMVKLSILAQKHIETGDKNRFYSQKIATTDFFASQLLNRNGSYLGGMFGGIESFETFSTEDFYRG
jgi:hypothetical protein